MLYSMGFQDQTSLQPFLREGKKTWDGVGPRTEPGKSSMLSRLPGPPAPYLTFCGSFPSEPGRQPAGRDHIWSPSLCFSLQIFWGTSGQALSSACIPSQLQERPGIVSGLAQALVLPLWLQNDAGRSGPSLVVHTGLSYPQRWDMPLLVLACFLGM